MASVTRPPASTVVPVLRAKRIHTFAFVLLDLKVITVKKVRGFWAADISLYVLVIVKCVFHMVNPRRSDAITLTVESTCYFIFLKSHSETLPHRSLWGYIQLLHNL